MKKITCLLVTALILVSAANAQNKTWKEKEDFHAVMSETFHPAEEGKLEPIKNRSQEMADKAMAWLRSTAPEGFDKNKIKESLKNLVKGAKELNKLVKSNAADTVLKEKLSALHDTFHQIEEKCKE